MSEQLSWSRLRALLRNESIGEWRIWLIASAVTVGAMFVGASFALRRDGLDPPFYRVAFFVALAVWGTIQSSLAFAELHNKSKNTAFLLLPASALEKTLAPLLTSTIVLIAYLLVLTTAASAAIEGTNWFMYRRTNELFDPSASDVWSGLPRYLVIQSWFFLGAAWFRRAHYLKTLLAVMVGGLLLAALALLLGWVAGFVSASSGGLHVQANLRAWPFPYFTADGPVNLALVTLWYVAQPMFWWWLAWLRVRETQVSHGV